MDNLEFIASLVQSIAWPVALLLIVIIFYRPIVRLISNIGSLEIFGNRVQIGRDIAKAATTTETAVAELKQDAAPAAAGKKPARGVANPWLAELDSSPAIAAIHAWSGLEDALRALARDGGIEIPRGTTIPQLLSKLEDKGLINRWFAEAAGDLQKIRNKIAHGQASLGYAEGLSFVHSAWALQRAAETIAAAT